MRDPYKEDFYKANRFFIRNIFKTDLEELTQKLQEKIKIHKEKRSYYTTHQEHYKSGKLNIYLFEEQKHFLPSTFRGNGK